MNAREPGPHADAPQDPESAGPTGLDGARQATERGIDAEPDPATAQAEHPETSSAAAYQRLSAEETTPAVTVISSDSFGEVELYTNMPDTSTGGYTALQTATPAELALLRKYDAPPYVDSAAAGSIPFLDFGNEYVSIGASYSPQVLSGLSWGTIATDLSNPKSTVAKSVDGTANYITAAICSMTGNQPSGVCTTTIRSLETQLKS